MTDRAELPSAHERGQECPFCGSADTRLERERGPGLCRRVHYCESCQQPFEQFR